MNPFQGGPRNTQTKPCSKRVHALSTCLQFMMVPFLEHLADYMIYLFNASSFWFSLDSNMTMIFTYPNDWVCPHRPTSTFLRQTTLLTFIQNGESLSRWLLHHCLPSAFVIACRCVTIDTLFVGCFHCQLLTNFLRWS